ncbi:hypothetical protein H0H92_014585 [Tricholoma furcatifolium]|nr:hypothetical protein H0H92_014585 [Tricholoma furcatifolium]
MTTSTTSTSSTKSADFWLHDGSIVLNVENTLFRVHQTILANHSQIFADLFSLPPVPVNTEEVEGDETIEGCRIVTLSDDSAKDFTDLLGAIYHPSHFDTLAPTADLETLLDFVSGILRLSTKYLIPALRKRCIALLNMRIPTTYEEYMASAPKPYTPAMVKSPKTRGGTESTGSSATASSSTVAGSGSGTSNTLVNAVTFSLAELTLPVPTTSSTPALTADPSSNTAANAGHSTRRSRRNSIATQHHHHQHREHSHSHRDRERVPKSKFTKDKDPPSTLQATFPTPKPSTIARTISLAQSTNLPTLLPYLYYTLAKTSSPRRFLIPPPFDSSSLNPTEDPSTNTSDSNSNSATTFALPWPLRTLLLVGRAHLHSAQTSLSHAFLIAPEAHPKCPTPALCLASRGPMVEWAILCTTGRGPEPLRPWERWERLGVCERCVAYAVRRHEKGREEVWERLPGFFELGSWKGLARVQDT